MTAAKQLFSSEAKVLSARGAVTADGAGAFYNKMPGPDLRIETEPDSMKIAAIAARPLVSEGGTNRKTTPPTDSNSLANALIAFQDLAEFFADPSKPKIHLLSQLSTIN